MAVKKIQIDDFIKLAKDNLVVDVRSPKEYRQAHFPEAISIPLFSDEERKEVGTTYKQKSREKAIKVGLDFFGPKMKLILNQVEKELSKRGTRRLIVHCWRGGMRSAAVAWLLDLYGFEVFQLEGGYKKFRNWALAQFEKKYQLLILGGYTGSAKTEILLQLRQNHQPVIDLEGLAGHKGSSFGNLNGKKQISTEQFENKLALTLYRLREEWFENSAIWVESESSRIGNVNIPFKFFNQMKAAERINIEVPFEKRLDFILKGYGNANNEALIAATKRISKRLGGLNTKKTIAFLMENNIREAFKILLQYYDKAYDKSRKKFEQAVLSVDLEDTDEFKNADLILNAINTYHDQ